MVLGAALIVGALSLVLWNRNEDAQAGAAAEEVFPQVVQAAEAAAAGDSSEDVSDYDFNYGYDYDYDYDFSTTEMTEVEIDGNYYVGYITIPSLGLELPVMSGWDYDRLKLSPCRYYGSTKTDDLVIAAHNYSQHFGNIKNLSVEAAVYFTDIDGVVSAYEVAEIDILNPTAVEEMTDSGFALTLFTCTYGGQSRVTVRCNRVY